MQVQVTLNLADPKQLAAFDALRGSHTGATVAAVPGGDAPRKPGRPTKEEVAAREAAKKAEAKDEEGEDFGDDEELEEKEEEETEEDEPCDDDDKKKIQAALRKFADSKGETGKALAIKVLKKFAPGVKEVKKSQVAELLKKLKVA